MRWLAAVVLAGCAAAPQIGAEPGFDAGQDAGQDASPATGGNAQGGAPAGGAAGSGGSGETRGVGGSAGATDAGPVDAGPVDAGTDAGPDVAPEVGLPCDWPAVFAACQVANPAGAKTAATCSCIDTYQGDPNCDYPAACGTDFCSAPSKGSGGCSACLDWLNTTWPQKCAANCASGTDCDAFFQCVKIKNC